MNASGHNEEALTLAVPINPLAERLETEHLLVLDGGLATALEGKGFDLDDSLWSAKVLRDAPEAIRQIHLDYLEAGADCLISSSYQASFAGFESTGMTAIEAGDLLLRSVRLATEAREIYVAKNPQTARPLIAASIGPYGAFLADGSEYHGRYGVDKDELDRFHRRRWQVLAASSADLLACETVPSFSEARVLLRLLEETPGTSAWMSFSCRDEAHLNDGTRLTRAAELCDGYPNVAAMGINCTAPSLITSLIQQAKRGTDKPIIVYPNSGESYDATTKTWQTGAWQTGASHFDWPRACEEWWHAGASMIGGCCRVGVAATRRIRQAVDICIAKE